MTFHLGQWLRRAALLTLPALAVAQTAPPSRAPFIIAPTVEGLMVCDEATQNLALLALDKVLADCQARKAHGAAALKRLLDTLEPGGPKGQVQVG